MGYYQIHSRDLLYMFLFFMDQPQETTKWFNYMIALFCFRTDTHSSNKTATPTPYSNFIICQNIMFHIPCQGNDDFFRRAILFHIDDIPRKGYLKKSLSHKEYVHISITTSLHVSKFKLLVFVRIARFAFDIQLKIYLNAIK